MFHEGSEKLTEVQTTLAAQREICPEIKPESIEHSGPLPSFLKGTFPQGLVSFLMSLPFILLVTLTVVDSFIDYINFQIILFIISFPLSIWGLILGIKSLATDKKSIFTYLGILFNTLAILLILVFIVLASTSKAFD